jgi:hypothetical protein
MLLPRLCATGNYQDLNSVIVIYGYDNDSGVCKFFCVNSQLAFESLSLVPA